MSASSANLVSTLIIIICAISTFGKSALTNPGINSISDKDTIIGGYNASVVDYPYQVSISWKFSNGEELFLCGGFIISTNDIVTAAHCVKGRDPAKIILRAGSIWRTKGTVIPIAKIIGHPDFDFKLPMDKDVAVMKTKKRIKFTDAINAVILPVKQTPLKDDSAVTISGWGLLAVNESGPEYLMAVKIPVVNFYDCWTTYGNMLSRNMWCAGNFKSGGIGPCSGDSGGAAVQNGIVYGIVSWSEQCALPGHPAVFADVAAPPIRDFIHKHTGL